MKRIVVLSILVASVITCFSQDRTKGSTKGQPFVQVVYHQGVHWNRTRYLDGLLEGGYRGIEARLGFQTRGREEWHQLNKYPQYGFGMHYADEVIGKQDTALSNPFSAFVFYNAAIARFGRFSLNTNISVGLSYMPRVYNLETNPYNDIVGSRVNLYLDVNLNLGVQLSERWDMNLGYGMNHYSNGNIHKPQKGLNNWGWSLGSSYYFGGGGERPFKRSEFIYTEPEEFKQYEELQFMLSVGIADWQPPSRSVGKHYMAISFTTDYSVQFSRRSAFTTGIDVFYHGSLENEVLWVDAEDVTTWQKMILGGHIGYQFSIDRLTLLYNVGTYFQHHSYIREFFFSRAGGRYRLTDHLSAHICIKAKNGVRSDWIEWGLVYNVRTR